MYNATNMILCLSLQASRRDQPAPLYVLAAAAFCNRSPHQRGFSFMSAALSATHGSGDYPPRHSCAPRWAADLPRPITRDAAPVSAPARTASAASPAAGAAMSSPRCRTCSARQERSKQLRKAKCSADTDCRKKAFGVSPHQVSEHFLATSRRPWGSGYDGRWLRTADADCVTG